MVAPTTRNRIVTLDVLRGVAILGILLANIPAFVRAEITQFDYFFNQSLPTADQWTNALTLSFVTGKFRSMLAILFGVGLALQFLRRKDDPKAWPGGYFKRTFFLAILGLIHAIFIWFGDILFIYSAAAFTTALMVNVAAAKLKWTIGILGALSILSGLGFGAAAFFVTNKTLSEFMSEAGFGPERTAAIYGAGTYGQQVMDRVTLHAGSVLGGAVLFLPFVLPLFLIGVLWARSGVLKAPSQHVVTRNWALGVGLGLGLPLNLLAVIGMNQKLSGLASIAWELAFGPILAVGYLMLGAVIVEQGWFRPVTAALAKVGQTALTCYLMQSVIATTLFYSWGFRLYGTLGPTQQLGVVAGIWVVNLVFAHFWLKKFAMGPVEWAWRSATEGRRLPIRRKDVEAVPTFSV